MSFESFSLVPDSLKKICGESNQVLVYGFDDCEYEKVYAFLSKNSKVKGFPIQRVFNWALGMSSIADIAPKEVTTLEGRKMNWFPSKEGDQRDTTRHCKAGLANLVMENYKRKREGLPLIPAIFCLEKDGDFLKFETEDMTTKEAHLNSLVSHSELRRMYKLCHDKEVPERVRAVAQETFKFVRLKYVERNKYALAEIDAPWKSDKFPALWRERMDKSTSRRKEEYYDWRKKLIEEVEEYDDLQTETDLLVEGLPPEGEQTAPLFPFTLREAAPKLSIDPSLLAPIPLAPPATKATWEEKGALREQQSKLTSI